MSVEFEHCKSRFKTKFKLLHYRLLRTVCKDQTEIYTKRAMFAMASKVANIIKDEQPKPLFNLLENTLFVEWRKWGYGNFLDGSKTPKGHQSLQNRQAWMKEIIVPGAGSRTEWLWNQTRGRWQCEIWNTTKYLTFIKQMIPFAIYHVSNQFQKSLSKVKNISLMSKSLPNI